MLRRVMHPRDLLVVGGLIGMAMVAGRASGLDPAFARNVTLYHEFDPAYASVGLRNQDTGDARGDSYFVLRGLILPVECAKGGSVSRFDCANSEENATRDIVTRNTVVVDSRFGEYASCNLEDGSYSCACQTATGLRTPCPAVVGRQDVKERELSHPHPAAGAAPWEFWRLNLAVKMGEQPAYWYSTTAGGDCGAPGAAPNCTWRLLETSRRITAECLDARVAATLRQANPPCFANCRQPTNSSSACVVECFMSTLLGPDGGARIITDGEGLDSSRIVDAWNAAFDSADPAKGGCPDAK